MSTIITGLFNNPADASAAIQTLESRGVPPSRISLVAGENVSKDAFAIDSHSKLPEGVAIGAGVGGAVGALLAGLTAVGAIASGGIGLIAAGPLVASLAGAGAGVAAGGAVGGIVGAMVPEHEVKHYQDALEHGSVMVGVKCEDSDDKDLVKSVFNQFEASKVSTA